MLKDAMEKVLFDPEELKPVGFMPPPLPGMPPTPIFNSPISSKENFWRLTKGEDPLWMPHTKEFMVFTPSCIPDCWARGSVSKPGPPIPPEEYGGKDMFGVEWEYVKSVHGSMVRPGAPMVPDLEHWEDYVSFPDIEKWDWAGSADDKAKLCCHQGAIVKVVFFTGLFERLISFVGMTEALIGMIDEDAKPAIHRLFDRLCILYDSIFAKIKQYFDADIIWFHDDWGSQRAPFFSLDTVNEMITPYLKRCVESVHRHGMAFELHCCGKVEILVPAMIEAGCDMWNGQPINDKKKVLQQYGDKIICDSSPDPLPPDATKAQKVENIRRYLQEFKGLRTYCRMNYDSPEDEYELLYEESRKFFCS